jgi:hypothetical protein
MAMFFMVQSYDISVSQTTPENAVFTPHIPVFYPVFLHSSSELIILESKSMQAVKVTYTVQEHYAEHNKENIRRVMADLNALERSDIRYSTFVEKDGKSFTHFAMRKDDEAFKLDMLASFRTFVEELKASNPEKPPVSVQLSLVGSSYSIF